MSRTIEQKPVPARSGLAGDLKRLKKPTDSIFIADAELNPNSLRSTAYRLKISIITRSEEGGLRVWRNFGEPVNDFIPPTARAVRELSPDASKISTEEVKEKFGNVSGNLAAILAQGLANKKAEEAIVEPETFEDDSIVYDNEGSGGA